MSASFGIKKYLEREDISKYLPYLDYHKSGIFHTSDEGFGLIFECNPCVIPSDRLDSSLQTALSMLPDGCYIQFSLYGSKNITYTMDKWYYKKKKIYNCELSKDVVENYKEFVEERVKEKITPNFLAPARNFRLFIAIKYGGKEKEWSIFDQPFSIKTFQNALKNIFKRKEYYSKSAIDFKHKKKFRELLRIKDRVKGSLQKGGLSPVICNADHLINFTYEILNQNHDFRDMPTWDGSDLNNFVFSNENCVEVENDYFKCDDTYVKTLSTKEYPKQWDIFQTMQYAGDILADINHSSSFLISLNVTKLSNIAKTKIKSSATTTSGQKLPYNLFPKKKFIDQDLSYAMDRLENGESPYFMTLQIAIFGNTASEVMELAGEYKSYFRTMNFKLEEDKFINFPAFITMLPFGYDDTMEEFLSKKRGRVVFGEHVTALAPCSADWKGLSEPVVPFFSPRGQFFGIDLFANKAGGFNAFAVGMTGSGKSVYLQWLALNYYLRQDRIWIIDIGGSYINFCKSFGGQYIELKREDPISLNPFTQIKNAEMLEEYFEFLTNFFLLLGLPKDKTLADQLERWIIPDVQNAIRLSYDKYGCDSDVETVVEFLIEIDKKHNQNGSEKRLTDFIKTIQPYRKGETYGPFVNGVCNIDFNSNIVVLEAGMLENMPDLLNPTLMLLTFQISKEIYLNEYSDQKNVVIMDEAHKFLKASTHVEKFIEQAYRRFRKHGASMILGTQSFEDFIGESSVSNVGRIIIDNSYWNFFLMQKSTSTEKIKDYFSVKDHELELMNSTEPLDSEYGEVLITTDKLWLKGRVVLNKFLQQLFFTNAEDRAKIANYTKDGQMTQLEAVKQVMKENEANAA